MSKTPFEIIETAEHTVACNGDGGALGHPKVYLHLDGDKHSATCPYCSRMFVLKGAHSTHHAA
jgi:uncharacterized Zn-finger protein